MKLIAALLACSLVTGCTSLLGTESGAEAEGDAGAGVPADPSASSAPGADQGGGAGTTGGSATSGSSTTPPAAGSGDVGAPGNPGTPSPDGGTIATPVGGAFADAGAYVATLGPSTLIRRHVFNGDNPAGQACLSCHKGAKGIPDFLFAGTVYADAARTRPAARVEVRVRDAAGKNQSAYTDVNGNFFFLQAALPELAAPAVAGIRNGTTTHVMTNAINNGDCNSCHRAGGAGALYLP